MEKIISIKEMQAKMLAFKKKGISIGFVPTMGYLHAGHLSLLAAARAENEITVVSIFVNPIQFSADEDYGVYPRNMERDFALVEKAGCDFVFVPTEEDMYNDFLTTISIAELGDYLCGASRPGHFSGVATVVAKLFNIIQPERAYFGQKDAQQVAVIKKMVANLNFPVEIVTCPIIREEDGLAKSSRNKYLNKEEREQGLVLYRSLLEGKKMIEVSGETRRDILIEMMMNMVKEIPQAEIDYIEIVDTERMQPLTVLQGKVLLALAVKIGKTRLIDNMVAEVK